MAKKYLSRNDFIEQANNKLHRGIYLISGKSGSGKTRLIKESFSLRSNAKIFSHREFIEIIMFIIKTPPNKADSRIINSEDILCELFRHIKYIIIEDIDYLHGKPTTLEILATVFLKLTACGTFIIITGIDLEERMEVLLKQVNEYYVVNFDLH